MFGGTCEGDAEKEEECNMQECPGKIKEYYRSIIKEIYVTIMWQQCLKLAYMYVYMCQNALVDCEWDDWKLGECSVTCGGGMRIDNRTLRVKAMYGGTCDPNGNQREVPCNNQTCRGKSRI